MSGQKAGSADEDPCCGSPRVTEPQTVTESTPWKGRAGASQIVREFTNCSDHRTIKSQCPRTIDYWKPRMTTWVNQRLPGPSTHQLSEPSSFYKKIILFLYLGLCWAFMVAQAFCPVAASGGAGGKGSSPATVQGSPAAVASLAVEHVLWALGPQRLWGVGSVVAAPALSSTGSVLVAHGLSGSMA